MDWMALMIWFSIIFHSREEENSPTSIRCSIRIIFISLLTQSPRVLPRSDKSTLHAQNDFRRRRLQSSSQLEDRFQGGTLVASLKLADVCTVIPALKGQLFLRYLPCFAQLV